MAKSCVGCVFLYEQVYGYSNYTVTDISMFCAQRANPELPADKPCDWHDSDPAKDNWPATQHGRCELYAAVGVSVSFDVDGEDGDAMKQIGSEYPHFALIIDHHKENFQ